MAKHDEIQKQLNELRNAVPELKGVLLASNEGLSVAHSFANGTDAQRVAAMAAAASILGRRISETLGAGALSDISVGATEGQVFVYAAGANVVLAVISPANANVGLIHLEARTTAQKIGQLFGSEQEFDKVPVWRECREFGLPGKFDGSVGPLVGGPVSRSLPETEAVPSREPCLGEWRKT